MRCIFLFLLLAPLLAGAQTIYVVRHAEKETPPADADRMMRADPPLSAAGMKRAAALFDLLKSENITQVWSTPFKRTRATVQALADYRQLPVRDYAPRADSTEAMVKQLLQLNTGVVLIAGHSNTVDDIVNAFTGEQTIPGDLSESQYGDLFILRKKEGKYVLERSSF